MIKWLVSGLVAFAPLLAAAAPAHADINRPMSRNEHGCDFYTGYNGDGAAHFYERDLKFYTLNPEWKIQYKSSQCDRYCRVFLYERPQLKVFYDSFYEVGNLGGRLDKAQSARIHCANDGDMHRQELKEQKEAEAARKANGSNKILRKVPLSGEMKVPLTRP